jgi:hypothetical protein
MMSIAFRALKASMAAIPPSGNVPRWTDLMMELWPAISSPLTWEAEKLLVEILRSDGRLHLVVSSDLPHSMPPEDMLKSLAVQALARWAGLAYLQEMERVQATTQSSSLSSLVEDVIQKTRQEMKPRAAKEEVAVSSPQEPAKVVPRRLGKERGMTSVPWLRTRAPRERELASC